MQDEESSSDEDAPAKQMGFGKVSSSVIQQRMRLIDYIVLFKYSLCYRLSQVCIGYTVPVCARKVTVM